MAFVVEDDTGLNNANSYLAVVDFDAYHNDRGNSISGFSTTEKEQALVKATDHIDRVFRFKGDKGNSLQNLEWPRIDAFDRDNRLISGVADQVKDATAEYALRALEITLLPDPEVDATGSRITRRSERVGPIAESVEFASGGAYQLPKYPNADRLLRDLVAANRRLIRG